MTDLAKRVYHRLQEDQFGLTEITYTTFANGEIKPKINETMRHKEIYLFHGMQHPDPNTAAMKLFLTVDALSRASVENITAVLPYLTYSRQDRKDEARAPISARLMANLLGASGNVNHLLTMDLHAEQIEGFYNIPVDNLYGARVFADYFQKLYCGNFENVVVYSPDFGGAVRARRFARMLDPSVRTYPIEKTRTGPNQAEVLNFLGDPRDKDVIIYDDMIDTGGSIIAAAAEAERRGAKKIYLVATHGLFSTKKDSHHTAEERFSQAGFQVITTESIPRTGEYQQQNKDWLTILPLDGLLATAVYESSRVGGSINSLFGGK